VFKLYIQTYTHMYVRMYVKKMYAHTHMYEFPYICMYIYNNCTLKAHIYYIETSTNIITN